MKKRAWACALTLCICLALLPLLSRNAAAYDYTWFNQKVAEIKRDYPEGTAWSNANSYPSGWYGCWAFANIMAERIFGYSTPRNSWETVSIDSVLPGDILRSSTHTMFVIGVSGDDITLAEGNYGEENHVIHYGRETTKAVARNEGFTVYRAPNYDEVIGGNPSEPTAPTITLSLTDPTVDISWNDVGAGSYYIYVQNMETQAIPYSNNVGRSLSIHLGLSEGKWRAYVMAVYSSDSIKSSYRDFGIGDKYKTPEVNTSVNGLTVDISWNDVGANSYYVNVQNIETGETAYSDSVGNSRNCHLVLNDGKYRAFVSAVFGSGDNWKANYKDFTITTKTCHTVSFAPDGGSGSMANQTVTSGGSLTLPACAFTPPSGKRFKTWSIGGKEYAAGTSYTVTGNTTVTAVWENIPCGITGEVSGSRITYTVTYAPANTLLVAVRYDGGRMTDARTVSVSGSKSGALTMQGSGMQFKLMLVDGTTYAPLCTEVPMD